MQPKSVSTDSLREFFISRRLLKKGRELGDKESLFTGGIIDSLGILELTAYIEARYGLKVDESDLVPENFDSLLAIKSYIESKLQVLL